MYERYFSCYYLLLLMYKVRALVPPTLCQKPGLRCSQAFGLVSPCARFLHLDPSRVWVCYTALGDDWRTGLHCYCSVLVPHILPCRYTEPDSPAPRKTKKIHLCMELLFWQDPFFLFSKIALFSAPLDRIRPPAAFFSELQVSIHRCAPRVSYRAEALRSFLVCTPSAVDLE